MPNITVTLPELSANYCCIVLKRRIEEIDRYHFDHPELPRQDDVRRIYSDAYEAINSELPNYLRNTA